jgi:2,4-dienoyl-CoA reductase-like NADH-dependent reductase (Old Yellow Enzyme family)/NADPH-dependent 2,4-dienoyl-CoA reductase/sulfur reductase-like enzyme
MAYENLLARGKIGSLPLRNRIALSPMGTNYSDLEGQCTEQLTQYYEARAKGGTGLIILETSAANWPSGASTPNTIGFSDDRFLPGLQDLVSRVHKHDAAIAAQINHAGKTSTTDIVQGRPVLVPSIPKKLEGKLFSMLTRAEMATFVSAAGPDGKGPRYQVMTQDDINDIIGHYVDAARRAKKAGFDAIELHAGHGYLMSSFLSPFANDRQDHYGGSAENRARLVCEVIQAIRLELGDQMPIIVRLDAHEYCIDGGTRINDAIQHAKYIVAAGADAIDVSAYGNGLSGIAFTQAPLVHEPGGLLDFAKAIKKTVNVPVIAVGRISPEVADQEIGRGNIDFVAMGRKLLADPDLPKKLASDPTSIRPCIYCYVCVSKIFLNEPMVCAVNPATGRELELADNTKTSSPKSISIVGAGPAGLEAARVLALRGHAVQIFEKTNKLGGTARIAALPYQPNGELVEWLVRSVKQLPIKIHLNTEVSAESLKATKTDHVILAVGATRVAPPMIGKQLNHVFDGDELRGLLFGDSTIALAKLAWWQRTMVNSGRIFGLLGSITLVRILSKIWMPVGKRVVLIGGGLVGLELAEYLIERGRKVTVIEPSYDLGKELSVVRRARVLHMLEHDGATLIKNAEVSKITSDAVHYKGNDGDAVVATDNVIISLGAAKNMSLADQLSGHNIPVSSIGDGHEIGYIEGAILSARKLAVTI